MVNTVRPDTTLASRSMISGPSVKNYMLDCYKKKSKRDVPMMKGDWGPRVSKSYDRWDPDLQKTDHREAGSLSLKRRDIKAKTLAKTYSKFAEVNSEVTLGSLRGFYGVSGISALLRAIRLDGIPKQFRA